MLHRFLCNDEARKGSCCNILCVYFILELYSVVATCEQFRCALIGFQVFILAFQSISDWMSSALSKNTNSKRKHSSLTCTTSEPVFKGKFDLRMYEDFVALNSGNDIMVDCLDYTSLVFTW